jgi:hypothetical protein
MAAPVHAGQGDPLGSAVRATGMVQSVPIPAAASLRAATLHGFLCQGLGPSPQGTEEPAPGSSAEPALGSTAQPTLMPWISEEWVRSSINSFGPDAPVVFPSAHVVIEDLLKLLLGQPPSANPGEGANIGFFAGDNIVDFFCRHARFRRAITSITAGGGASSEADDFVVVPDTTQRHCVVFGIDFMQIALDAADSRHAAIIKEALSSGRYIIFPMLDAVHYVPFGLDLWERKVYVLDGMQPRDGAAAEMSSTTTSNAEKVCHAPLPI